MNHKVRTVIFGVMTMLGLLLGMASQAAPALAAPAAHAQVAQKRCTIHYAYSNGLTGGLFPKAFSKVEFTTSSCGDTIQTVVRYHPTALTGCTRAPLSGTTTRLRRWVQSTGPNIRYCDAWVRFHCAGCAWGKFEKLPNTSAKMGDIKLTAYSKPLAAHQCSTGSINWSHTNGTTSLTSWWVTNPCHQYQSPKILADNGHTYYGNVWRTSVGAKSTASSGSSPINKAWIRYKNSANGQHYCHRVIPPLNGWFACDN